MFGSYSSSFMVAQIVANHMAMGHNPGYRGY